VVERLEFIIDKILYVIQRGNWCDIVVNAHAPTEAQMATQRTAFMWNYRVPHNSEPTY
jgi:hypothetical protein